MFSNHVTGMRRKSGDNDHHNGMNKVKRILKRKYSRKGCLECKRRKIKCDEAQPVCGNCFRVKFPCVYPLATRGNRARTPKEEQELWMGQPAPLVAEMPLVAMPGQVPRAPPALISGPPISGPPPISEGVSAISGGISGTDFNPISGPLHAVQEPLQAHIPQLPGQMPHIPQMPQLLQDANGRMMFENVFDDANTLVHNLADFDILGAANDVSRPSTLSLSTPDASHLKPFHLNIILNEPKDDLFNEDELREYLQNGTDIEKNPELALLWSEFNLLMADPAVPALSNEQLVEKISANYKLLPAEHEYFKHILIRELFLFIFPFAPLTPDNQVMQVLLEYLMVFKYLVYALIALLALCLFNITKEKKHEQYQKKATAVCMKLLVAAFADLKNNENSLWHIEGLILTVLLLTMLFCDMIFVDTVAVPISWTAHLNKARSLLIKYNTVKTAVYLNKPDLPGISIARLIFFAYDCMSKFSVPLLKITRYDLHDLWMLSGEANEELANAAILQKLGILVAPTPTELGFNLLTAFPTGLFRIIYKVLDVVASINEKLIPQNSTPQAVADIIGSISQAMQQRVVPNVQLHNTFLIEPANPAHPDFQGPNKIRLPLSLYGKDTDNPAETLYYSWCDVALRSQMLFLYLRVVTSEGLLLLHRKHPIIQALVLQTLDLMFFLKPKLDPHYSPQIAVAESENYWLSKLLFDFRAIMIQLPFRLALDLTDEDDDFEKLELYFRGLVKFGAGSCMESVGRAKKNRERARARRSQGTADQNDYDYQGLGYIFY